MCYYFHFTDEASDTQRSWVYWPRSHHRWVAKVEFKLKQFDSGTHAVSHCVNCLSVKSVVYELRFLLLCLMVLITLKKNTICHEQYLNYKWTLVSDPLIQKNYLFFPTLLYFYPTVFTEAPLKLPSLTLNFCWQAELLWLCFGSVHLWAAQFKLGNMLTKPKQRYFFMWRLPRHPQAPIREPRLYKAVQVPYVGASRDSKEWNRPVRHEGLAGLPCSPECAWMPLCEVLCWGSILLTRWIPRKSILHLFLCDQCWTEWILAWRHFRSHHEFCLWLEMFI